MDQWNVRIGDATVTSWEWMQKGWWYLNDIEVHEDCRDHGFGGLMLYRMTEELAKRGALGVYVAPAGDLSRLEKFYSSHGFERLPNGLMAWGKRIQNPS